MWVGIIRSRLCERGVLVKNGSAGLTGASPQYLFFFSWSIAVSMGFFGVQKGWIKGILCLLPFHLVMEGFSILVNKATEGGFFVRLQVWLGKRGDAGHTFVVFWWHVSVLWGLYWPNGASEMGYNLVWDTFRIVYKFGKSVIIPVGVVDADVSTQELGCVVNLLPTTYLLPPLQPPIFSPPPCGARHKALAVWNGVEERFRKKPALWKTQSISKGGGITRIYSTLAWMPLYLMLLFRVPKTISKRLEKIQRDFSLGRS